MAGKADGAFIAGTLRPPMAGRGFIAVPTVALDEAVKRYGFQVIGHAKSCRMRFHAITDERRIAHPAVALITNQAQAMLKQGS